MNFDLGIPIVKLVTSQKAYNKMSYIHIHMLIDVVQRSNISKNKNNI